MDCVSNSEPSSPEENGELIHHVEGEGESSAPALRYPDGILHRWYNGKADGGRVFPDHFHMVPTDQRFGLDLEDWDERQDVIERLLASNNSHDNRMMLWRRRHKCLLISGESPVEYAPFGCFLRKLKSNGKVPRHLALETFPKAPRFNIFSLEVDAGLKTTYQATLRRASEA